MLNKQQAQNVVSVLKEQANDYLTECKEISKYVAASRGFFEGDKKNSYYKAFSRILSNVAIQAMYILVSGIMSGLTSKSKRWLHLQNFDSDLDENYEVRVFLEKLEKIIYRIFDKSNVYEALPLLYEESCAFGTSCALVENDDENVVNLLTFTAGQYYIDINDKGKADTFARQFDMTVKNIVEKFGYENCPDNVKSAYDQNQYSTEYVVNHLICPNSKFVKGVDPDNKAYFSYYWIDGDKEDNFIHVGGYASFPMIVHRLKKRTTQDSYGIGLGSTVVPMMKEQFKKIREKLKAIEKIVNPPVLATNDIKTGINLLPGGITRVPANSDTSVRTAYNVAIDLNHLLLDIDSTKKEIHSAFFADLFSLFQTPNTTATEAQIKDNEKLAILGTFIEGFENEMLVPLIQKVIEKIFEQGIIRQEEIPDILLGEELKIEFLGTLAQAQKQIGLGNLANALTIMDSVAKIKPATIDNLDEDKLIRKIFTDYGLDTKILRDPAVVEQIRQEQQRQQEQLQQQQTLLNMAKVGKDMGQSKIEDNNLLGKFAQ